MAIQVFHQLEHERSEIVPQLCPSYRPSLDESLGLVNGQWKSKSLHLEHETFSWMKK